MAAKPGASGSGSGSGPGGRNRGCGCGIGFGVFWILFSSVFVVAGLGVAWESLRSRSWDQRPCTIERFEIAAARDADPPFRPDLVFSYEVEGQAFTGTRLWRDAEGVDEYEDLAKVRASMLMGPEGPLARAEGIAATCRVNPSDPAEAVLADSPAEGVWFGIAFAGFGAIFVLVGVGILMAMRRQGRAPTAKTGGVSRIGSGGSGRASGGALGCVFFGVFALAGLGMFGGLVVPTSVRYFDAKGWVATPAEVVWSTVRSHSSDDGTTYSVDIFYRYEFDGIPHASNRWDLVGGSSSGYASKQEIVRAHPPGTRFTCYVDPDRPWRAMADRELGWWALFGLFPLPFLAVGLGGLWFLARSRRRAGASAGAVAAVGSGASARQGSRAAPDRGGGFGSSRKKRVVAFIGTVLVAAFWNGIVSVFVWQIGKAFAAGRPEWFLTIFMIPFVVVGLLLLLAVPYNLLLIFSPIYRLSLSTERLKPGARATLSWKRTGGGGEPRRLTIWLLGREQASYQRGTSRATATALFHEHELFTTESAPLMPGGRCDLAIPRDAVPSFEGAHNKLEWFVKMVVDVPWRPDVIEEHEIEVEPLEPGDLGE